MKQEKLDPELKARWINNLRSNEFQQGRGELQTGEKCYCCLGVLDYTEQKQMWDDDLQGLHGTVLRFPDQYGITDTLQNALASCNDGQNSLDRDINSLRDLFKYLGYEEMPILDIERIDEYGNTTQSASFNSIANWIEKNL